MLLLCLALTALACGERALPDWAIGEYDPIDAGRSAHDSGTGVDAGIVLLDAQAGADAEGFDASGATNPDAAAVGDAMASDAATGAGPGDA